MRTIVARRILLAIALIGLFATSLYAWYREASTPLVALTPQHTPTPNVVNRITSHFEKIGNSIPAPSFEDPSSEGPDSETISGPADFLAHQFVTPSPVPLRSQNGNTALYASSQQPAGTTGENSPLMDTFRELQLQDTPQPFSQRIYGSRSRTRTAAPTAVVTATVTPTPTVTGTPTLGFVHGQPTGFTLLALMHPAARPSMERQIETLLDAKVRDLYLGALVDGSFDINYAYLSNVIRRLNTGGRTLTLVLYFANGPSMRNYETTYDSGEFNLIPPEIFRDIIQNVPEIQLQYRKIVARANQVFDLNRSLNPKNTNIAIPMLEDNLDYDSWLAIRRIARAALDDRAEVMRNPCLGCYQDGKNNADSVGSGNEYHKFEDLPLLSRKDSFSMDGKGYIFPWESTADSYSIEQTKALKNQVLEKDARFFGLWRAARQGLGGVTTSVDPDDRVYEIPTAEMRALEIELLRHGLTPEEPSEAESAE